MLISPEAFEFHNAATPKTSVTDAIPGGRQQDSSVNTSRERSPTRGAGFNVAPQTKRSLTRSFRAALSELEPLLPKHEAASLLVDTYFDRAHWFILIFHQDEFRKRWQNLYDVSGNQPAPRHEDIDFVSVFLMVIAIGLRYAGTYRVRLLATHDVDVARLSERIFTAIKAKLLDILSCGSLEAVQTCILLGTYYLYHGSPALAWPVCGCGLRIGQALNLHRRLPRLETDSSQIASWRNQNETRKRCWWAIYEIETFCSMSYGYPHSIKDADCDVELLDPSARSQVAPSPRSFDEPPQTKPTLLSYKYLMSKLSILIKSALAELYRIGTGSTVPSDPTNSTTDLHHLVQKVASLDAGLQTWLAQVPPELQIANGMPVETSYSSLEELDQDVGAKGLRFENHILQLQALALKLAYENARTLIHRPLLSYKLVNKASDKDISHYTGNSSVNQSQPDPFRSSLQACREAALNTSEVALMPITELVSVTYAGAFVGIHTFTAGITLGILCSLEPLSPESQTAKSGLHRLISIQSRLKDRYPVAAQSLEILQRLTKHVMDKELSAILDVEKPPRTSNLSTGENTAAYQSMDTYDPQTLASTSAPQQSNIRLGPEDAPELPESETVGDIVNFTSNLPLQYGEDPALSQAIYDFDRGIPHTDRCSKFRKLTNH